MDLNRVPEFVAGAAPVTRAADYQRILEGGFGTDYVRVTSAPEAAEILFLNSPRAREFHQSRRPLLQVLEAPRFRNFRADLFRALSAYGNQVSDRPLMQVVVIFDRWSYCHRLLPEAGGMFSTYLPENGRDCGFEDPNGARTLYENLGQRNPSVHRVFTTQVNWQADLQGFIGRVKRGEF